MPDVFNKNPYVISAVMAASFFNTVGHAPANAPITLKEIYWYAPVAAGDLLTITDGNGNVIKQAKCEVAGQSRTFDMHDKQVQDFQVTVIGSGTVYIERD
jgi:acyl dehydratase